MKPKFPRVKTVIRQSGLAMILGICLTAFGCTEDHNPESGSVNPKGPKPAWAPDIKDDMWAVIEKLLSYGDRPIPELTPQQARMNHTVKDAVMDLLKENNLPLPMPAVDTMGKEIPVQGGSIHARVYTPKTGKAPFPIIVYYHGGGWVIANIDVYDASAAALAEKVGAMVVSVGYRKGPEHKFPTAHNDAYEAYLWVLKNAASMNGNPEKMGVAGESAGGNLAANVSIKARDNKVTMPLHQLLVYPVANSDTTAPSYIEYGDAKPLDKPSVLWFLKHYLNNMDEAKDPRITLVAAKLNDLPETTIIGAEIDPLASEGMLLAEKLRGAGVTVNYMLYKGVTHEFFGTAALVKDAVDAQALAANDFKKAFGL